MSSYQVCQKQLKMSILKRRKDLKKIKLKYGENPNQDAYLISNTIKSIFDYQISGKKMSYNNVALLQDLVELISKNTEAI